MSIADLLILALLALVILFAFRGVHRSRAKGCGGCCAGCPQACGGDLGKCGKAVDKARSRDYNNHNN